MRLAKNGITLTEKPKYRRRGIMTPMLLELNARVGEALKEIF